MLQADIYEINNTEYIVIDCAMLTMEQKGMALLADRRDGVGADRLLLVDSELGSLVAAVDSCGAYQLLSLEDCQVANVALGKAKLAEGMRHSELHITQYFLSKLLAPARSMKIAS